MNEDLPKGGQGGCYTVEFILNSYAFLLEFANYRLHQCFWHESILSLAFGVARSRCWLIVNFSNCGATLFVCPRLS